MFYLKNITIITFLLTYLRPRNFWNRGFNRGVSARSFSSYPGFTRHHDFSLNNPLITHPFYEIGGDTLYYNEETTLTNGEKDKSSLGFLISEANTYSDKDVIFNLSLRLPFLNDSSILENSFISIILSKGTSLNGLFEDFMRYKRKLSKKFNRTNSFTSSNPFIFSNFTNSKEFDLEMKRFEELLKIDLIFEKGIYKVSAKLKRRFKVEIVQEPKQKENQSKESTENTEKAENKNKEKKYEYRTEEEKVIGCDIYYYNLRNIEIKILNKTNDEEENRKLILSFGSGYKTDQKCFEIDLSNSQTKDKEEKNMKIFSPRSLRDFGLKLSLMAAQLPILPKNLKAHSEMYKNNDEQEFEDLFSSSSSNSKSKKYEAEKDFFDQNDFWKTSEESLFMDPFYLNKLESDRKVIRIPVTRIDLYEKSDKKHSNWLHEGNIDTSKLAPIIDRLNGERHWFFYSVKVFFSVFYDMTFVCFQMAFIVMFSEIKKYESKVAIDEISLESILRKRNYIAKRDFLSFLVFLIFYFLVRGNNFGFRFGTIILLFKVFLWKNNKFIIRRKEMRNKTFGKSIYEEDEFVDYNDDNDYGEEGIKESNWIIKWILNKGNDLILIGYSVMILIGFYLIVMHISSLV